MELYKRAFVANQNFLKGLIEKFHLQMNIQDFESFKGIILTYVTWHKIHRIFKCWVLTIDQETFKVSSWAFGDVV